MPQCSIPYIPEHLHQNDKTSIPDFFESEKLYWRLRNQSSAAPFSGISLYDVSCNRSGENNSLSVEGDVLWNIDEDKPFERYQSEITTIIIRKIFSDSPAVISVPDSSPDTGLSVVMSLVHDPLPCNYAHTLFVFKIDDDTPVTKENYNQTFKSNPYKRIRQTCRDILNKAIIQKEITFEG